MSTEPLDISGHDIRKHFDHLDWRKFKFIRPAVGKEITLLHESDVMFPNTEVMGIRLMTLAADTAVGFHMHEREKFYEKRNESGFAQIVYFPKRGYANGKPHVRILKERGDELVIPPRTPHGIIVIQGFVEIRVIGSSKNPADIIWQDGYDELLKHQPAA